MSNLKKKKDEKCPNTSEIFIRPQRRTVVPGMEAPTPCYGWTRRSWAWALEEDPQGSRSTSGGPAVGPWATLSPWLGQTAAWDSEHYHE